VLTALELENFKGVAARQRIDFAPLTLLFGANSAGKSTILQALLYLHEILERGIAEVDRTVLGGDVLELGGFTRLVHRHETDRPIVLRAEFSTPRSLERFGRNLTAFPFPDLDDQMEHAWVELTIRCSKTATLREPIVESAAFGVGAERTPLVVLDGGMRLREGLPLQARINVNHPAIAEQARELAEEWKTVGVTVRVNDGPEMPVFFVSRSRLSALPHLDEPLRIIPFGDLDDLKEESARLESQPSTEQIAARKLAIAETIRAREETLFHARTFLEMIVLGTTSQLAALLRDTLYIGPLRTVPPRGFLYERAGRVTSWADGLAAWDHLLADRSDLVERTNQWLKRVGAGCQIVVQQLFDRGADAEAISEDHPDKTLRRILLDTGAGPFVLPSEVGAGISQIIPVIVAALEKRPGISLVEQPELHVHPAVQVGLGDLFIDAVTREGSQRMLLVETHSEHLILRLLRRIRETTASELKDGDPAFAEDELSVLYVENHLDGVRIRRLRVDEQGEFKDRWPRGFFAERMEELL